MPHRFPNAEDFASAVLLALEADERNHRWLSRKTGIAYSTLRSQLEKPARLSYANAVHIADVVELEVAA